MGEEPARRTPVPDPTELTTEQLRREVGSLQDLTNARMGELDTRLNGLKDLVLEKFNALATLTDKLSLANATALTAALSAAEKAVGEQNRSSSLAITKSEQAMQEALKQLQTTFQTEIKGITGVMATMQSRLDRGEGVTTQQRDEVRSSIGTNSNVIAIGALGLTVLTIVVMVVLALSNRQPPQAVQPTMQMVPAPTAPVMAPVTVPAR